MLTLLISPNLPPLPTVDKNTHLQQAAADILHLLKKPTHSSIDLTYGGKMKNAYIQIAKLLDRVKHPPTLKLASSPSITPTPTPNSTPTHKPRTMPTPAPTCTPISPPTPPMAPKQPPTLTYFNHYDFTLNDASEPRVQI